MTRTECEDLILEKLEEINTIYREYCPDGMLMLHSAEDGHMAANNEYWESGNPINVTRFPDGLVEHWDLSKQGWRLEDDD